MPLPSLSRLRSLSWPFMAMLLAACSGGGGGVEGSACNGSCVNAGSALAVAEVERVLAQVVAEASARNAGATVAVVDRVGNVLGVFRMNASDRGITVDSGRDVAGGLEKVAVLPDTLVAISKAMTAAYTSTEGNAFSTRTSSQIVQEFFAPGERDQPSGPLFGVQFSSLPCSDMTLRFTAGMAAGPGPQRTPLGLSADSGGFPLYKNGVLVGGVGAIADSVYGLDLNVANDDHDIDELIALAGTAGFEPPADRRADRITLDGKTLRYSDVDTAELASIPSQAPALSSLIGVAGNLQAVRGYADAVVRAGTALGTPASGVRAAAGRFGGLDGFVLVDAANAERYAPRAGTDAGALGFGVPLQAAEVEAVLRNALAVANRLRSQIRRPLDSQARVSISVTDTNGSVLGVLRSRDAPMFGLDVSLQKARSVAFFSSAVAADELRATPDASYLANAERSSIGDYVDRFRVFMGNPEALGDGRVAYANRSLGNLARPYFPDGLTRTGNGPLSKPIDRWSIFSTGLQLDLVNNALVRHTTFVLGGGADVLPGACTEMPATPSTPSRLANGLQIFAGAVPIYRGGRLIGAIGVSGDGTDQDDTVAFLGLHNASVELNNAIGHAPPALRADRLSPGGTHLRYVQCPQKPFLDSEEQNVCQGK